MILLGNQLLKRFGVLLAVTFDSDSLRVSVAGEDPDFVLGVLDNACSKPLSAFGAVGVNLVNTENRGVLSSAAELKLDITRFPVNVRIPFLELQESEDDVLGTDVRDKKLFLKRVRTDSKLESGTMRDGSCFILCSVNVV